MNESNLLINSRTVITQIRPFSTIIIGVSMTIIILFQNGFLISVPLVCGLVCCSGYCYNGMLFTEGLKAVKPLAFLDLFSSNDFLEFFRLAFYINLFTSILTMCKGQIIDFGPHALFKENSINWNKLFIF